MNTTTDHTPKGSAMDHAPPTEQVRAGRALLDVKAAARQLSIGRTTLFGLLRTGEIESVKIGTARRIPVAAIHAYIQRKTAEARAA